MCIARRPFLSVCLCPDPNHIRLGAGLLRPFVIYLFAVLRTINNLLQIIIIIIINSWTYSLASFIDFAAENRCTEACETPYGHNQPMEKPTVKPQTVCRSLGSRLQLQKTAITQATVLLSQNRIYVAKAWSEGPIGPPISTRISSPNQRTTVPVQA